VYGKGSTSVIDLFIKNIKNGEQSTIYGDCTRDYVYIDDIVNVTINAVLNDVAHNIYDVGTGREILTEDLYNAVKELMGSNIEAKIEPMRNGDIQSSSALMIPPEYEFIELEKGLKYEIDILT
jgi:nucleoside-diphosphate-sugar epimerase